MKRLLRIGALTLVVSAGLLRWDVARATACGGGSPCIRGTVAPASGLSVSASAPALPVLLERDGSGDAGLAPDSQLLDHDKHVVATQVIPVGSSGEQFLVPVSPLTPGAYFFRRGIACDLPGATIEDVPFTVTSAQPLPTVAGVVTASAPRQEPSLLVQGRGGRCTAVLPASVVDLTLTPSLELAPFLSIAQIKVSVDGTFWASSQFWGNQILYPPTQGYAPRINLSPFTACGGESSGEQGVPEGHHVGTLTVSLPGVTASLPPVTFEFDTSCAFATQDGGASQGGMGGGAGTGGTTTNPDAGAINGSGGTNTGGATMNPDAAVMHGSEGAGGGGGRSATSGQGSAGSGGCAVTPVDELTRGALATYNLFLAVVASGICRRRRHARDSKA